MSFLVSLKYFFFSLNGKLLYNDPYRDSKNKLTIVGKEVGQLGFCGRPIKQFIIKQANNTCL